MPEGFHRMGWWPADIFAEIAPPAPQVSPVPMHIENVRIEDLCEISPVIWKDRLCLLNCARPGSGGTRDEYYLVLRERRNGRRAVPLRRGLRPRLRLRA